MDDFGLSSGQQIPTIPHSVPHQPFAAELHAPYWHGFMWQCVLRTCLIPTHQASATSTHTTPPACARTSAGLEDLTVLSSSSHILLPATSALSALTRACLLLRDLPQNVHKLQHLPQQLRKLEVTVGWAADARPGSSGSRRPPLPLRHLTGLSELRGSGYFTLQVSAVGPASLGFDKAAPLPGPRQLCLQHSQIAHAYQSPHRADAASGCHC
jgi:hypothetical protein